MGLKKDFFLRDETSFSPPAGVKELTKTPSIMGTKGTDNTHGHAVVWDIWFWSVLFQSITKHIFKHGLYSRVKRV